MIEPRSFVKSVIIAKAHSGSRASGIFEVYWIVEAVGKHIIAENALAGGDEGVGVVAVGGDVARCVLGSGQAVAIGSIGGRGGNAAAEEL